MINRMPLIVQSTCDSGRIALDRAHFSKKSKRNSTEGIYVSAGKGTLDTTWSSTFSDFK